MHKYQSVRGERGWYLLVEQCPGHFVPKAGPYPTRAKCRQVRQRAFALAGEKIADAIVEKWCNADFDRKL